MRIPIRGLLSIAFVVLTIHYLWAQESKAPPKLKADVEISLRTLRERIANDNIQMLQIEKQYKQLQDDVTAAGNEYTAKYKAALKNSDLDDTKYELDANTLVVKEKPKVEKKEATATK